MAPSSFDSLVVVLPESPADIVSAAQPSPAALTPPKGSAIQNLDVRLARREERFSRLNETYIECEAQLVSLQEQVTALASSCDSQRSERDVAQREFVSQDEEISSLLQIVRTSQTSVVDLALTSDTLPSEVTDRTSEVAALRVLQLLLLSQVSQSTTLLFANVTILLPFFVSL